jgi:hypothetical protein
MRRVLLSLGLLAVLFSLVGWAPVDHYVTPPTFPNPLPLFPPSSPTSPGNKSSSGQINPLTGLPVNDPGALTNPPALLSITNWPVSARPQAGLSYASMVFELYIGDGESRFLGMFYGDYPPEVEGNPINSGTSVKNQNTAVGPLRSARLPYESLRKFYNGFLVMASGFQGVLNNLEEYNNFFGSDSGDINSAFVNVSDLKKIANASKNKINTSSMQVNVFTQEPPVGGSAAPDFWFIYNAFNQIHWQYDPHSEAYIRYQDQADGKTFVAASDRLNGDTLTFENVILLFADHRTCTEYAFDVNMLYINKAPALLFRDGKVYKIYWTTKNTEYEITTGKLRPIRFIDADGNPFPLKPGQTWVHLVPNNTPVWEAPQTTDLYRMLGNEEPGSGNWVSRFYSSLMIHDEEVCNRLR